MKYLLEYNNKKYSDEDLIQVFHKLGIAKGDILCVHTDIMKFGFPLLPRDEFLQSLLSCFFEVIDKEGTLIMPTFTYSFCKNEIYDKLNSKSKMGVLTEFWRKQKDVKRSNDPIFSFAIKGAKEDLFLQDTQSCFGKNSVYDILAKENGKIILFGTQIAGYTFTHFIEEVAEVPYRYFKEFKGKIIFENKASKDIKINYYVRNLEKNSDFDVYKQIEILKQKNNFKIREFGNSCIILIESKAYLDDTMEILKKNLNYLLTEQL